MASFNYYHFLTDVSKYSYVGGWGFNVGIREGWKWGHLDIQLITHGLSSVPVCVLIPSFYKDTSPVGLGLTVMTSF